jgi:hypothetical protein
MWFMSKILTDQYIDKLNRLINEFEQSPHLTYLLDFFLNNVEKDQKQNVNRNQKIFSLNEFEKLKEISRSSELKRIFAYIKIIIKTFEKKNLQIHINVDLPEKLIENIIALFAWDVYVHAKYDNGLLEKEIYSLNMKTSRELNLLDDNGHSENKLRRERKGWRHRLKLIEQIKSFSDYVSKNDILLNLNTSAESCVYLSEFSVCPESMNTFVNFGNSRKNIFKEMGQEKVERLSMIINLFPSTTGKNIWYKDFMSDEINRYNNFKKIITITFGEKTPEALLEMQKQKKFQAEEIYTIFSFEL